MSKFVRLCVLGVLAFIVFSPTCTFAKQVTKHKHHRVYHRHLKKHLDLGSGPLDGNIIERRRKLAFENEIADKLGLPRFQTLDEIKEAQADMVRVPDENEYFFIDPRTHINWSTHKREPRIDPERRYLQPWAYTYLWMLAKDFHDNVYRKEYPKIKNTSMVRDLGYQRKLPSFAQCLDPETCSTHLTGASFDISFRGMTKDQFKWMYERLTRDRDLGIVHAIHEPYSGCFHIFVIPPEDPVSDVQKAQ